MRMPCVAAAATPRGPATTAPLGPAQPARTTPAAHSTACAVGMTPASRRRTVAIANSVGFISYLLVGSSSGGIARQVAPREREQVLGENFLFETTLGNYSETNQKQIPVAGRIYLTD